MFFVVKIMEKTLSIIREIQMKLFQSYRNNSQSNIYQPVA